MKKIFLLSLVLLLLTGCGFSKSEDTDPILDEQEILDDTEFDDSSDDFQVEPPALQRPPIPTTPPVDLVPDMDLDNRVIFDSNIDLSQPLALVDTVEVLVLESFPPQYNAVVTGNFRNGCESRGEVTQLVTGNTIEVAFGIQSVGEICTMALVPFKESIMLDMADLVPGNYILSVNGVTTQFNVQ